MKKLALTASTVAIFASAMVLTACGSDGKVILPDASVQIDGGNNVCDVLMGTGCAADEKCSFDITGSVPFPSICIKAGAKALGDACSYTEGLDDCAKGLQCFRGTCATVCGDEAGSCSDDGSMTCTANFGDVWTDQTPRGFVGFCVAQCDPTSQAVCLNDLSSTPKRVESCQRKIYTNPANPNAIIDIDWQCVQVDLDVATQTAAGDPCNPAKPAGDCFINYAPRGTTLLGVSRTENPVITPFCHALETHTGVADPAGNATGDPAKMILGSDPIPRPGDCSATNFGAGNGNYECHHYDEFGTLGYVPGISKADMLADMMLTNDQFDLPAGPGRCSDITRTIPGQNNGDPPIVLYPSMVTYDLSVFETDMGDGKFDETDYTNCWYCLTTERWIEVVGAIGARIKNATKKSSARVGITGRSYPKTAAPMKPQTVDSILWPRVNNK